MQWPGKFREARRGTEWQDRRGNAGLVTDRSGRRVMAVLVSYGGVCNVRDWCGAFRQEFQNRKEKKMVYKFKSGAYIKADAQAAGEMCERLASENRLTAEELVEENRPEDAPLHKAFEWDDNVAAEEWRKHQARHIIASIICVKEEDKPPIRAFFNIVRTEPEYKSIDVIMKTVDETKKLLAVALGELRAFKIKYATLSKKLAPVFDALDQLELENEKED